MIHQLLQVVREFRVRFAALAVLSTFGLMSNAQAALTFDVRFSDGATVKDVNDLSGVTVDLYAVVTGADSNHANDAFRSAFVILQSSENNGGVFNGALTAVEPRIAPFNDASTSQPGTGSDLNSDGVGDWGSNSTAGGDVEHLIVRSSSSTFGGAAVGSAVGTNGWEFKIASWSVNVGSLIVNPALGASTDLVVTMPSVTPLISTDYATYTQDGVASSVKNATSAGVYGDFVTITVPEPSTLAILGLGGAMLIARRRNAR